MQVAVTSSKGKVRQFRVSSKYKRLVMSTRYNMSPYTARTMLRSSPLRRTTVKQICRVIQREVHQLCSIKYGASVLRDTSPAAISTFSWKPFIAELKLHAPCLYAVVKAAIGRPKKTADSSAIGISAAVMLKRRSRVLSQAQAVTSVLLYAGHCSKRVGFFALAVPVMLVMVTTCISYYHCQGLSETKCYWPVSKPQADTEDHQAAGRGS